jgi:predicted NodU family carbamoyl transferase
MRILGVYIQHDACAAIFDDYRLIAAVAQERPTRRKGDGGRFPTEAVRECLEEARLMLSDVDVVCLPRTRYPKEYFTLRAHSPGGKLTELFGGEEDSRAYSRRQNRGDSMGHLYYHVTQALGFRPLRCGRSAKKSVQDGKRSMVLRA